MQQLLYWQPLPVVCILLLSSLLLHIPLLCKVGSHLGLRNGQYRPHDTISTSVSMPQHHPLLHTTLPCFPLLPCSPFFYFILFFLFDLFILRSYSYRSLTRGAKRTAYLKGRSCDNANKVAAYRKGGLHSKGGPNSPIT